MKSKLLIISIICVCMGTSGKTQTSYKKIKTDSISVGSKAPPLTLKTWIKGEPVTELKRGRIYLLEFTIINCPHCGPAIPILNEIAKKYKDDVTVIAVYFDDKVFVKQYVDKMGDRMNYSVAVDDSDESKQRKIMYQTWMVNASNTGYPSVTIVDRDGKISWMGHPCSWYVNELVDQIVSTGTYDKAKLKEWNESAIKVTRFAMDAREDKDKFTQAIHLLDSFLVRNPNNGDRKLWKLRLLLKYNEPEAYQYAKSVLDRYCSEKNCDPYITLNSMAKIFIEHAETLRHSDWDFVALLADTQNKMSDKMYSPFCISTKAEAMYLKGDYQAAVRLQESAIDHLKYRVGEPSKSLNQIFEKNLLLYKEKAGL